MSDNIKTTIWNARDAEDAGRVAIAFYGYEDSHGDEEDGMTLYSIHEYYSYPENHIIDSKTGQLPWDMFDGDQVDDEKLYNELNKVHYAKNRFGRFINYIKTYWQISRDRRKDGLEFLTTKQIKEARKHLLCTTADGKMRYEQLKVS